MKKMFVFILIIFLLCGINLININSLSFDKLFVGGSVEVYLPDMIQSDYRVEKNGNGSILFCEVCDLDSVLNTYFINGFTLKIKDKKMSDVLALLSPSFWYKQDGFIYGYINGVKEKIKIDGRTVNFQCAIVEDLVCVGFPILLGSY